jgi:hypothetical protein
VGDRDFTFDTGGSVGWELDGDCTFYVSLWIVGWDDMDEVFCEVLPRFDLFCCCRRGQDVDVLIFGERAECFAVTVVWFVLRYYDQV